MVTASKGQNRMIRFIKAIATIMVLVAAGWSAWWYMLASGQEAAIALWFEDRRAAGWQAEHGEISVSGFPMRLNRRIEEIAIADPKAGWAWELPGVDVLGAAQSPTRIAVQLPPQSRVSVPGQKVSVQSEVLEARLELTPGTDLSLETARVLGQKLRLAAQSGWTADAEHLEAEVRARAPEAGPENTYSVQVNAEKVEIPKPVLGVIDPTGLLEARVDGLKIEGQVALLEPLDRHALEQGQIALAAVSLKVARLDWGDLAVEARGAFDVSAAGYPEGKVKLRLRNWRQMIRIARDSGAVDRSLLDAVEQGLEFVALLAGGKDVLEVPLDLEGGKVRIGPVTIADAPRVARPR